MKALRADGVSAATPRALLIIYVAIYLCKYFETHLLFGWTTAAAAAAVFGYAKIPGRSQSNRNVRARSSPEVAQYYYSLLAAQ